MVGAAHAGAAYMHTGGRTTQPVGHYEFCQREPGECSQKTNAQAPVELTRALWGEIVETNNAVNVIVTPRTDMEMWGRQEVWSFPVDGIGDCEDYVLEKRRRLIELGLPAGNLLVTVARQSNGEGHAVLVVKTSRGEFVLDNIEPRVLPWTDTGYIFLKRQSERNSGVWVQIEDGGAEAVASLR
jgi:predicted transglutaminase-like cysteine proteinase